MKTLTAAAFLLLWLGWSPLRAQDAAARSTPAKAQSAQKKDPLQGALGVNLGSPTSGPVTTEIYAEEAFFDSANYIGIFSGRVIVNDPRFNIQADKLTIYLSKGEDRGLEKAVAEGNVGVIRERPAEGDQPASRSIGRAETAIYTAKDGNVELKGTPRLQSGLNTHIAMSPETVMIVNQGGQLTTRGPSRTEIRQEPKAEPPKP
jgi:lipopolysaccharide transport protein LptA